MGTQDAFCAKHQGWDLSGIKRLGLDSPGWTERLANGRGGTHEVDLCVGKPTAVAEDSQL